MTTEAVSLSGFCSISYMFGVLHLLVDKETNNA